jgi:hypothetical protein
MNKWIRITLVIVLMALVILFAFWWNVTGQHWLAIHTGTCPEVGSCSSGSGAWYGFWSGFGSDLGELTIVAAIALHTKVFWTAHTCRGRWWCWRPGTHRLEGTNYQFCHDHHPDDIPSARQALNSAINDKSKEKS